MSGVATTRAWGGALLAALGLGLHFVWPPALGLATLGVLLAHFMVLFGLNIPSTRLAHTMASLVLTVGLAHATASPWLCAAALLATLPTTPHEPIVRAFGYRSSWVVLAATLTSGASLAAAVLAGGVGSWLWAVAPLLLWAAVGSLAQLKGLRDLAKLHRPAWKVKIGERVPDFTLLDRKGEPEFRLADQRGRYVLVVLLAGDWCPLCHVKMRIYQKEASNLAKQNVTLALVSPSSGALAVDFARNAGLGVQLLADPDNKVAKLFDAVNPRAHEGKDAPIPSSFLVDPEGRLAHASRPDDFEGFIDPRRLDRYLKPARLATA